MELPLRCPPARYPLFLPLYNQPWKPMHELALQHWYSHLLHNLSALLPDPLEVKWAAASSYASEYFLLMT